MALWSRPSGGGFKPPTGALAEDRCAERRGKRRARSRQVWVGKMSDGRESSAVDVSKESGDVETRAAPLSWDQPGGYPITVQAASGI